MRIGKKGEPVVHQEMPDITIGKCTVIKKGNTVCILNAGNTLPLALEAAEQLDSLGFGTEVASFHAIKPLDEEYLGRAFSKFELVATLEEHSILGGFGGAVSEWLSDQDHSRAQVVRFGTADDFFHTAGDQAYARKYYGLTKDRIVARIMEKLQRRLGHKGSGKTAAKYS